MASEDYQRELTKAKFNKLSEGMPANLGDPYPVDHKLRLILDHLPAVKEPEIEVKTPYPECVQPVIEKLIAVSNNTEERLFEIENNLAIALRYLFRMASRMQINCVYYGGQKVDEVYNNIRCLDDDRIYDTPMSLDQCLNCTRYEPVYGQVYSILDEEGVNAQQFMDDWQMAYLCQEGYVINNNTNMINPGREKKNCLEGDKNSREVYKQKDYRDSFVMNFVEVTLESQYNLELQGTISYNLHAHYDSFSYFWGVPSEYEEPGHYELNTVTIADMRSVLG